MTRPVVVAWPLLAAVAVLTGQAAPALGAEPPASISVAGGVGISVSDDTATYPEVTVEGDVPLYLGDAAAARLRARLELSGLPGEATDEQGLSLLDPQNFKAAGASLAVARRIGRSPVDQVDGSQQGVYLELVGETWTRLVTRDAHPRDRFAGAVTAGVRLERRTLAGQVDRYVSARWGRSDVASSSFGMGQVVLEGRARLVGYQGVNLTVGARVDVDVARAEGGRDRFNVFIQVERS